MKKYEWLQKNMNLIVLIFLYMQPIIDLFTSFCIHVLEVKITIGIVIRVLFLLFLLFYYLFVLPKEARKKGKYIWLIAAYLLLFMGEIYLSKDSSVLFYELYNTVRALKKDTLFIFL